MQKWLCLITAAIVAIAVTPAQAIDPSIFVGTIDVQFQPMQSAGVKEGCSLVYRAIQQDIAYQQGKLIAISGSIVFISSNEGTPALGLKVATINLLDDHATPKRPYFAYIQTPHGTTAGSKVFQADSPDMPGGKIFTFNLDEDAMKVMGDIHNGSQVTIGFNRTKGGMDVLVPLDLSVIESTVSDTGYNRRHSDETIDQFSSCVLEISQRAKKRLEAK